MPKNPESELSTSGLSTRIGNIQVRPVKSYVDVTDDNYPLLELLDAVKDLKIIPDVDRDNAVKTLLQKLNGVPGKTELVTLALKYPPRVRALTGALLEQLGMKEAVVPLYQSINPLTTYSYRISNTALPARTNWNIV